MDILVIGDPHIRRTTIPESREMVRKIVEQARRIKPKFIVVLGDTLDRFGDVRIEPQKVANKEFLGPLVDICHVYLLIGNHDMDNNSRFLTDDHAFTAQERWSGITVVDHVVSDMIDGKRFTFCPYVPEGRFIEALDTNQHWRESHIIFCHQTFYDANMGAIKSTTGDKWDINFPNVISGHLHDYDQLQSNILYIGTPIQMSFGDKGLKTISLIHPNDTGYTEDRIDLQLPKRVHFKLNSQQVISFVPPESGVIKITVTGTVPENLAVKKLTCVKLWESRGISVVYKNIKSNPKQEFINNISTEQKSMSYGDALYLAASTNEIFLSIYKDLYKK